MKLFDEKGKLFGKINIIDLLVILVVIVALIVVGAKVLGAGFFQPSQTPDDSAVTDEFGASKLTYVVRVTAQRKEIAERVTEYVDLAAGKKDQLMHGGEIVDDAYVVDFWTEPCRYNITAAGQMEMIAAAEAEAAGLVDFCFVVEAIAPETLTNKVGTIEVRIGKPHNLKTTHLEFINGFVVDCEWEPVK